MINEPRIKRQYRPEDEASRVMDSPHHESEGHYGQEHSHERTPGVYVRSGHHQPHELDMLWSGKLFQKEERRPAIFFGFGMIAGIIATSAVFLLIINKPTPPIAQGEGGPLLNEVEIAPKPDEAPPADAQNAAAGKRSMHLPSASQAESSARASRRSGMPIGNAQYHTVKSGETLGAIAYQYYGESSPELVEKITRANNLSSPDAIAIDQKLVVPPKRY